MSRSLLTRARLLRAVPLLALGGCSALVQIDDEKYLGSDDSNSGSGGGDGDLPGNGDGDDSGGGANGGSGGSDSGGNGSGGTAETGGSTSGGTDGSGGTTVIEVPVPDHHYALDGNVDDTGSAAIKLAASITNGAGWQSGGVFNQAYEVPQPGSNHYLDLSPELGNTSPFTISWWFSPIGANNAYALISKLNVGETGGKGFSITTNNGSLDVRFGGADQQIFPNLGTHPTASAGAWTHIVFAYEENFSATRDRFTLWINGEMVHEEDAVFDYSGVNQNNHIRFGYQEGGMIAPNPYSGLVDEIRFYNSYLSDGEARAIYELEAPE